MSDLPFRDTARALVLDPRDRLLLIAYESVIDVDPLRPGLRKFWFTPGGGLDPGETHEIALVRELEEEIGRPGCTLGRYVAWRNTPFYFFREPKFLRERYFVVRLDSDAIDTTRLAETEDSPILDIRWWTMDELQATTDIVDPRGLSALVMSVLAGQEPESPVVIA
jgi:8-oxo-dGTP pyrophosphatase MutT (NUDIX family)